MPRFCHSQVLTTPLPRSLLALLSHIYTSRDVKNFGTAPRKAKSSTTPPNHTMLKIVAGTVRPAAMAAAPRAARAARAFASHTLYDNALDYGLYRSNIYTHRLPELTAEQLPELVALHARLALPKLYLLSTLLQALNMERKSEGLANNFGLNTLGKTLLSYYVAEALLVRYPRLPMPIHNQAVDAYMGVELLSSIGRHWGVQPDRNSKLEKYLAQEPFYMRYGRLRYMADADKEAVSESGVEEVRGGRRGPTEDEAYALAVRSVIGGVYVHASEDAAKEFIRDHVLLRHVAIDQMFQWAQPMRELVRLGEKLGFRDPLEVRLIAETGRLLLHAIFVTGVFVGTEKLGEGVGLLLAEAKTRAAVNALMGYYLYLPVQQDGAAPKVPSDADYTFLGVVGLGDVAI